MSPSSQSPRRPSAGSRTTRSRRPRKVAGRTAPRVSRPTESSEAPEPEVADRESAAPAPPGTHPTRRLTTVLVAAIVVLGLVVAGEAYYLFGPPSDPPVVSAQRPVIADEVDHKVAVDTAAKSAELIVARSYKTYDDDVEAAAATMTDSFAEQYRATTGEIKDSFVKTKTEVSVEVVAQAVQRASPEQVQALLFLNQYVTKDGQDTAYTPYRALATMVKTEQGWLVSKLETR